jgi:hypothetical protein
MTITPGGSSAGRPPQKPKVHIIRAELLDSDGNSFEPPQYEFWVIDAATPPKVLAVFLSLLDAQKWILVNEYQLQPRR